MEETTNHSRFVMPSRYTVYSIGRMAKCAMADFWVSAAKLYTPELKMKQTTWPLQMVWFSLSFGSYGLLTWINTLFVAVHLENVYFNAFLFALSNLPGNILSALLMDRVKRSTMLVGSVLCAAGGLFSFAFFAAASTLNAPGIVVSACIFQCFTASAWNTIDCMTSELFPTSVRSTGMGVCAASGRVGAMVAQFINGALVANPVRLLLVASMTLLLGATTPCLLPNGGDMTGQPVQDEVVASVVVDTDDEHGRGDGESAVYRPVSSHDNNSRGIETNGRFKRSTYQDMEMA
jgi:VNT family MFS transporter (synaptic vesicle glycoprotein 2)